MLVSCRAARLGPFAAIKLLLNYPRHIDSPGEGGECN